MYEPRTYRKKVIGTGTNFFEVRVKETDLLVHAPESLFRLARESILKYRGYIESYIREHPGFKDTLKPWRTKDIPPQIVADMILAGIRAGTGPMAAVAGAVSEYVGKDLLLHTDEIAVENGGDIFLKKSKPAVVALYCGQSPLNMKIGIRIDCSFPLAVCTSSGTIGHSFSMGKADAACVVSESGALADAAATAIANQIPSQDRIEQGLNFARKIDGILGVVVVFGEKIGAWGNLEIVPLKGKRKNG